MPQRIKKLFKNNRRWVGRVNAEGPALSLSLVSQQNPEYLWIGCSDSCVSANQIIDLPPGEVFVHCDIANVVVYPDLNCLSVLQFAVKVLKIRYITTVGHHGCFGVKAAPIKQCSGLTDNWIRHVQDVAKQHETYLGTMVHEQGQHGRPCELDVIHQANNVYLTMIMQDTWDHGQPLAVHGWIYGVEDGMLRNLGMAANPDGEPYARFADAWLNYGKEGSVSNLAGF